MATTQVIVVTTEAIAAHTAHTESTAAPPLPPPRKRPGRPRRTSNNGNLAHSDATARSKPASEKRTKTALQIATAIDAAENIKSKEDTMLAPQKPGPPQERPVRERPSRAAAKIANAALKRAARDTSESVEDSTAAVPVIVKTAEPRPKRKAKDIGEMGASIKKQSLQGSESRSSLSSLRESETPPWDPNADEIPVDFEWPPRKIVLGPAPVKPFREPLAFLHERLRPFGSYDKVPPQERITLAQRKAVNQQLEKIIQQDPKTGEIHYVCPKPLRGCTYHQKMVLEAAFDARRIMLIDHHRTKSSKLPLQEGDYGFVSVLAQCTSDQVKAYFALRADIEARLLAYEAKENGSACTTSTLATQDVLSSDIKRSTSIPKSMHTEASTAPRLTSTSVASSKQRASTSMPRSRHVRTSRTKGVASSVSWNTIPRAEKPARSQTTTIHPTSKFGTNLSRRITFACNNDTPPSSSDVSSLSYIDTTPSRVPSQNSPPTGTNPEEGNHTDDGNGCSPTTPKDTHQFIKLEEEEGSPVVPSWSISRYLSNNTDADYLRSRLESEALQGEDSAYILAYIARLAKSLLESELKHVQENQGQGHGHVTRLQDYISTSSPKPQFCCYCRASIFSVQFMCRICAKGFCADCCASPKVLESNLCVNEQSHRRETFLFCGRYAAATLESFIERLDLAYAALPGRLKSLPHAQREARVGENEVGAKKKKRSILNFREPDQYHHLDVDVALTLFQQSWAQGVVTLLHGVEDRLEDLDWDLDELVKQCEHSIVNAIQCTPRQTRVVMDADKYFERPSTKKKNHGMEQPTFTEKKTDSVVLKMQGWPSQDFESLLPSYYANLMSALPLKDYTHPQGKFNLAKYMPEDRPLKLSPMIYHGHGHKSRAGHGSIQLSCEPSDTIYVCVKSGAPYQEKRSERKMVAVWEIFRAEDRPRVESFLQASNVNTNISRRSSTGEMEPTDPFTFGNTYLDDLQLQQLYEQTTHERANQGEGGEKEGVRPYRVKQAYGEAVMIPAGCLRQARFVYEVTLAKVDFMSPERAGWTLETTALMRRCSLARQAAVAQQSTRRNVKFLKSVPDTLQSRNVLLYSALAAAKEA
ncbi:hypothetical protein BGZ82_010792 [Podila clonocystis]|nr:hypothetical protein BGZ82_010792 [Podila clonocystis]